MNLGATPWRGSVSSQVPDSTQLKRTAQIYSQPVGIRNNRGGRIICVLRCVSIHFRTVQFNSTQSGNLRGYEFRDPLMGNALESEKLCSAGVIIEMSTSSVVMSTFKRIWLKDHLSQVRKLIKLIIWWFWERFTWFSIL